MKELDVKQENERKKEYLDGYRKCVRQLDSLNEELSEIRINKMFPSLIQDGMPHAHTTTDLSGYAARIDKIERKIVKARYQKINKLKNIRDRIERMSDENEKDVLFYRYIKGMKWEEIAVKMMYTYRNVTKIHGRALKNFQI